VPVAKPALNTNCVFHTCQDAQRVGGGGDLGADVKTTDPLGRRWVTQCKHRRNGIRGSAVGTPDLQVLSGTARTVHGADVAVIVTNGRMTGPAVDFAKQQRLHVVDPPALAPGEWDSPCVPLLYDPGRHAAHVHDQVALASVDQFPAVEPSGFLAHRLGSLDGLGVQDHRHGAGTETVVEADSLV
jgi:hypothetical protein